jgi:hypothetical protein
MSRNYHSYKFDKWPDTDYQAHEKFAGGAQAALSSRLLTPSAPAQGRQHLPQALKPARALQPATPAVQASG